MLIRQRAFWVNRCVYSRLHFFFSGPLPEFQAFFAPPICLRRGILNVVDSVEKVLWNYVVFSEINQLFLLWSAGFYQLRFRIPLKEAEFERKPLLGWALSYSIYLASQSRWISDWVTTFGKYLAMVVCALIRSNTICALFKPSKLRGAKKLYLVP